jgi:hypothetical protein
MVASQKPRIIDNPSIGETYANKLVAATFDGGAVVVTLGTARFVPEQEANGSKDGALPPVHVTARLALSPTGAVELASALNSMLNTLKQRQEQAIAARSGPSN